MLPQLETPRMLLREVTLDDGPALQGFQSTPSYASRQAVEPQEFADGTLRVSRYLQYRGEGTERRLFVYVAMLRGDCRVIGTVNLSRLAPGIGSLGVGIDQAHAGHGLRLRDGGAPHRLRFADLKLHRIEADVALENLPCIRLLEAHRDGAGRRAARLYPRAGPLVDRGQVRDPRRRARAPQSVALVTIETPKDRGHPRSMPVGNDAMSAKLPGTRHRRGEPKRARQACRALGLWLGRQNYFCWPAGFSVLGLASP